MTNGGSNFNVEGNIQGNLYVQSHPSDSTNYGDGSIKVDGRIHVDTISTNLNHNIDLLFPVSLPVLASAPTPTASHQLYYDATQNDALVTMDSAGTIINLQPVEDVLTLVKIYESNDGTRHQTGAIESPRYTVTTESLPTGTFRIDLFFEWATSQSGSFLTHCSIDGTRVLSLHESSFVANSNVFTTAWTVLIKNWMTNATHVLALSIEPTTNDLVVKTRNIKFIASLAPSQVSRESILQVLVDLPVVYQTSNTASPRFTATTESLPTGIFQVELYFEWALNQTGDFTARLFIDETLELSIVQTALVQTDDYAVAWCVVKKQWNTETTHTLSLVCVSDHAGLVIKTRRVHFTIS